MASVMGAGMGVMAMEMSWVVTALVASAMGAGVVMMAMVAVEMVVAQAQGVVRPYRA